MSKKVQKGSRCLKGFPFIILTLLYHVIDLFIKIYRYHSLHKFYFVMRCIVSKKVQKGSRCLKGFPFIILTLLYHVIDLFI